MANKEQERSDITEQDFLSYAFGAIENLTSQAIELEEAGNNYLNEAKAIRARIDAIRENIEMTELLKDSGYILLYFATNGSVGFEKKLKKQLGFNNE